MIGQELGKTTNTTATDLLVGAQRRCAPTGSSPGGVTPNNVVSGSLEAIVHSFKSAVTKRINIQRNTPGAPVWQRNYCEHIIRTERALNAIRRYIVDNPPRWHLDRYNPAAAGPDPLAHDLWRLLQDDARTRPHGDDHPGDPDPPEEARP